MAEGIGDSGWQRHWEMGVLLDWIKCLQKPEWGSYMLSRSRLLSALTNLWLQQHCPANKIDLDPWFSWTEIEEHFRASLNLPFTAFVSQSLSHLHKPRWEAWRGHQTRDNITGVMESCKMVIWQFFPLATLSCSKALQLPVVHLTVGTDPSTSGFTGRAFWHWQDRRKSLLKTKFWISKTENSRYLIKDGVLKRLLCQHCQHCSNSLLCQLMQLQAVGLQMVQWTCVLHGLPSAEKAIYVLQDMNW